MDSSTYGSKYYQTPNMSRLAKEGMLFTDAYAASPLCSPTRASIMSGQYPSRLRMTVAITAKSVNEPKALKPEGRAHCGKVESKNHMPLEVYTLAEALKDGGYTTAHIGKWHLAHKPEHYADHQGFDFVIGGAHLPGPPDYYSPYRNGIRNLKAGPKGEYLNERLAEESIQWIQSVKGKPFFLNFWHYAVHGPIIAKKDLMPKYQKLRDPKANQRCPRSGPKNAPNRPRRLILDTSLIRASKAGSQKLQLLDQNNKPRQTHALILQGHDWVQTESNPDGSVTVTWDKPKKNATILLGWKGGATCFDINDWTIPPCKLVIERKQE